MHFDPLVTNPGGGPGALINELLDTDGQLLAEKAVRLSIALTDDIELRNRTWREAQVSFIDRVGGDPLRDRVVSELVKRESAILAEPISLAVLAALAVSYGEGSNTPPSFLRLLMWSAFEAEREPGTETIRFSPEDVASAIASVSLGSERVLNVRWRFRQFYLWATSGPGRGCRGVDLSSEILRALGMSYEDWITATIVVDGLFSAPWVANRDRPSVSYTALRALDVLSIVRHFVDLTSVECPDLANLVCGWPLHEIRPHLYAQVLRRPLLVSRDERFMPLLPSVIPNSFGLGWYYKLVEARSNRNEPTAPLFELFGDFYEDYIVDLILRWTQRSGALAWPEQRTRKGMSADAIVLEDGILYLFEVVSGRLTEKTLLDPANEELIDRDFRRLLYSKVDQLRWNIDEFTAGNVTLPDLGKPGFARIYPVLVQYKSLPRTEAVQAEIDQELGRRLGSLPQNVRPLEILDAETFEGLEEHLAAGLRLRDLIEEKLADPQGRVESFKNYLYRLRPTIGLRMAPWIRDEDRAWESELQERRKSWLMRQ